MPERLEAARETGALARLFFPFTGAAMALLGAGCATDRPVPVETLRVAAPPAGAPRPLVYLWVDAAEPDGTHEHQREQDVPLSRGIRDAVADKARQQEWVSAVLLDPIDAAKADYRVRIVLDVVPFDPRKAVPWPGIDGVYALGDDYYLTRRERDGQAYRARIGITDRRGRIVGLSTGSLYNADGGSGPNRPGATRVGIPYRGAGEYTGARLVGLLGSSAMFPAAPPKPVRAPAPPPVPRPAPRRTP